MGVEILWRLGITGLCRPLNAWDQRSQQFGSRRAELGLCRVVTRISLVNPDDALIRNHYVAVFIDLLVHMGWQGVSWLLPSHVLVGLSASALTSFVVHSSGGVLLYLLWLLLLHFLLSVHMMLLLLFFKLFILDFDISGFFFVVFPTILKLCF